MHPVLRRVLLHGGLTAAVLALVGVVFAELAGIWLAGNAVRGAADEPVGDALRTRVPLTLAVWGFLFVLVCEVVVWRVRGRRPARPAEPPPDDAERLLNELLAQAEAAAEARGEGPEARGEGQGDGGKGDGDKTSEPPT